MLLSDVLKGIKCDCSEIPEMDVENITAKVNLIKEKTLFVLYKSINSNNDTRIEELLKMRPCAILTDRKTEVKTSIPIIYTENARMAYSYAMYNFCKINPKQQPKLQYKAIVLLCNPRKIPTPITRTSTIKAIGSWLFFFFLGVEDLRIGVAEVFVVSGIPITSLFNSVLRTDIKFCH